MITYPLEPASCLAYAALVALAALVWYLIGHRLPAVVPADAIAARFRSTGIVSRRPRAGVPGNTVLALIAERPAPVAPEAPSLTRSATTESLNADHELIALLSHEIRSPLAYIMASAELLLENDLTPDQRDELLRNVHSHAGRLGRLMENLLDAESLAHSKGDVEREPLALGLVAKRLIADAQARNPGRIICLYCRQNLPLAWGDEVKTEIVLENLLSNALKYSPAESRVVVSIEPLEASPEIVVSVHDEGIGIAVEHLDGVFGLYRRVGQSSSTPGHGIGLYVSKVFVEAQGGRIWVRSEPGAGSTFSFTLPRRQESWDND